MKAKQIIEEYFTDPDVVENLLSLFANDIDVWGDGDTPEERLRDALEKSKERVEAIEDMVNGWIENASKL